MTSAASNVPLVPFVFSVGVTGHRWLGVDISALRETLTMVLTGPASAVADFASWTTAALK